MRNVTLGELKASLRSELRQSSNPAVAQSADHILINALKRASDWVYAQHAWPHLRVRRDIDLQAGSYLYDVPAGMDYDRIEKIWSRFGDRWLRVEQFTEDDEAYNIFDTDEGVRSDPVEKYRIQGSADGNVQLEVWPIPASDGKLRVKGLLRPPPLDGDAAKCVFDDQIVLKVAASRLARNPKAADDLQSTALSMISAKFTQASTARNFHIGGSKAHDHGPRHRVLVVRVVS